MDNLISLMLIYVNIIHVSLIYQKQKAMTTTTTNRINQAIEETKSVIAKEMSYPTDLRNHALVASYELHLIKLNNMLNGK